MFTRCSILIPTGVAALFLLLGILHADPPSEHNPEFNTSLEPKGMSATNTSEPSISHSLFPESERVVISVDPAFPGEADGISHPAVEVPAMPGESAELAIVPVDEIRPVEEATPQPEEQIAPREATVKAELMSFETGPPPLRIEDLETVASRLAAIEGNLAGQQQQALDLVLSSNRTALIVGGLFAGVGVLGILMAALVLARILNQLSHVVMTLPAGQAAVAPAMTWPGYEPRSQSTATAIEQVSARFLGAIEQLEQRIHELERLPQPRLNQGEDGNGARQNSHWVGSTIAVDSPIEASENTDPVDTTILEPPKSSASLSTQANERHQQVEALLVEGENLLQSDSLENALEQFDNALAIEPHNADALIKRGMALERLQRMEAALESYDRAIASNGALTLAYLHKGAVCNRLQRYREALECYERALQTEHKS
jgi:hypothetical protein